MQDIETDLMQKLELDIKYKCIGGHDCKWNYEKRLHRTCSLFFGNFAKPRGPGWLGCARALSERTVKCMGACKYGSK